MSVALKCWIGLFAGLLAATLTLSVPQAGARTPPPAFRLPWTAGKAWNYLGGPHNTNGCPNGGFRCTGGHPWNSLDLAGKDGIVRAAADGKVEGTSQCPRHSNFVIIDHGGGWHTTYYHLADIKVKPGDPVHSGQRIGTTSTGVGCGGHADGAHVHFSVDYYTGPYSWHSGGVDLDHFQIGDWVFHDGRTQYSGCAKNVFSGRKVCPGDTIRNSGAVDCRPISPVVRLAATNVACPTARKVVNEWGNRSDCGPDGNVCDVEGFACRVPPHNGDDLRCSDGGQLIVGRLGPF